MAHICTKLGDWINLLELIVLSKQRGRLLIVIVTFWLFLILPRCLRLLARILLDMFSVNEDTEQERAKTFMSYFHLFTFCEKPYEATSKSYSYTYMGKVRLRKKRERKKFHSHIKLSLLCRKG